MLFGAEAKEMKNIMYSLLRSRFHKYPKYQTFRRWRGRGGEGREKSLPSFPAPAPSP